MKDLKFIGILVYWLLISFFIFEVSPCLAQKSGDNVQSIFIDEFDHKWFGTDSGLLWKSGNLWKAFFPWNSAKFNVRDIKHPKNKSCVLWLGTTDGIFRISYSEAGIRSSRLYDASKTNFWSDTITAIEFDKDNAGYFTTPKGIGVLVQEVWKFYTRLIDVVKNEFTSVKAKGDTVYLGTKGEGIARIIKKVDGFSGASSFVSPWSYLPGDTIRCIFIDSKGAQWYGTNKGLSRHTGTDSRNGWDTTYYHCLPDLRVTSIAEDLNGNVWVGTLGGLVKIKPGISEIRTWTTSNGLISNTINTIFIDKYQSIWIGTNKGISHLKGTLISNFKSSNYTRNFIHF